MKIILNSIFFFFSAITIAQEKIDLKLQLKVGDTYKISIPMKMPTDVEIKFDAQKMKDMFASDDDTSSDTMLSDSSQSNTQKVSLDMYFEMQIVCKVLAFNKNEYKFEMYYDYLENKISNNQINFAYNTKEKNKNLSAEQADELEKVKSIIGKKFTITTNEYGEVLNINNYEKVVQSVKKDKNKTSMQMQNNVLIDQLQPKEFKNNIGEIFDILPKKSVGIGDYWTREIIIEDDMMPYKAKTRYTLKEIQKDYLIIQSETILYSDKMNKKLGYVEGDGNSIITLNRNDNFSQIQPYNIKFNVNMELFGMEMNMNTNATCTYQVKK
jgi:hypothetical protein